MKASTIVGIIFLVVSGFFACKGGNKQANHKIVAVDTVAVSRGEPFIIEVVEKPGGNVDTASLIEVCKQSGLTHPELYKWQGHHVVYGRSVQPEELKSKMKNAFPGAEVNVYTDPFYVFDRTHCSKGRTVKKWEHVILTANLVKDTSLQKEYMDYHSTQFQQWPEVSNGFCNASFQQLLLFRNGRQLMLVISIPEGESLDELNPKTTENNPRVDEWNKLMKKYQEGLKGTKPGEVWVFLERQT